MKALSYLRQHLLKSSEVSFIYVGQNHKSQCLSGLCNLFSV